MLELPQVKKQIDVKEMKYLAVSEKMAHLPWAVKQKTGQDLENKIQNILVNLYKSKSGKKVLDAALISKILPAKDADYDKHRKIVKAVLNEAL